MITQANKLQILEPNCYNFSAMSETTNASFCLNGLGGGGGAVVKSYFLFVFILGHSKFMVQCVKLRAKTSKM